jgi:hypothetical protein
MKESNLVKLVVYVPQTHAQTVREAIGKVGAGKLGNYEFCSFSVKGIGRYKPVGGAKPFLGEIGKLEEVEEERIEVILPKASIQEVVSAMKKAHPYEEVAFEISSLLSL